MSGNLESLNKDRTEHVVQALRVFEIEAKSILNLSNHINDDFGKAVDSILKSGGRLVVCGVGKSGLIGRKIVATLSSTGTPSFFLHPTEAFHGDLGMVKQEDIVLAISKSGETQEVLSLIPFIKENRNILISMTGNADSLLAKQSHYHLHIGVDAEACPLNLAPTTSSTVTLVMGDALAIALMSAKEFKEENFARFHPGGSLGKKLLLTAEDQMEKNNLPTIMPDTKFQEVVSTISRGELGIGIVVSENYELKGIISDGDLRRAMEKKKHAVFSLCASDIMSTNPATVEPEQMFGECLELMERQKINRLLVVKDKFLVGVLKK
jgi:arabinose-5-phosphate isomerase